MPLHGVTVEAGAEGGNQMQPGGDSRTRSPAAAGGEFAHHGVPAVAVALARGAQVTIVGAGRRNEANASWSRTGGGAASRSSGVHRGGATIQPMPTAGDSVLLTEPTSVTAQGAAPCSVATARRS